MAGHRGWHRDLYPPYCAPLRGYLDDILENGPRYVQWNIPLYDDDVLWVVPGSHVRVNTPEEDAQFGKDDQVPVSGGIQTHLKAGDGVVYILPILHWGSNYSTRLRRTVHGGFSRFNQYMDRLHPGCGPKGKLLSTVYLSKTARRINDLKQPNFNTLPTQDQTWAAQNHPITLQWGSTFADCFTADEATRIWDRFKPIDALIRSDHPQYAPSFQGEKSDYHFIDMPDENVVDEFL